MEYNSLEEFAKEIQYIKNNKYDLNDEQIKFLYNLKYVYSTMDLTDLFDEVLDQHKLSEILDCNIEQIEFELNGSNSYKLETFLKNNTKYYFGNLDINYKNCNMNNLILPEIVIGSIFLCFIDDKLKKESKIELPKVVYGDLSISNLKDIYNLVLPKKIYGNLHISNIEILKKCKSMELLYSLDLLILETDFYSDIIYDLPTSLLNININMVTGTNKIKNIKIPSNIKKISISNIGIPSKINILEIHEGIKELSIETDINMENIKLPDSIEILRLNGLKKIDNLYLPKNLKELYLDGLIELTNLTIPDGLKVLSMRNLIKFDNLVIPQTVKKLYMDKIKHLNNIDIPKNINILSLNGLLDVDNLVLPLNMNFEEEYDKKRENVEEDNSFQLLADEIIKKIDDKIIEMEEEK